MEKVVIAQQREKGAIAQQRGKVVIVEHHGKGKHSAATWKK